jgi:hypothetical protein
MNPINEDRPVAPEELSGLIDGELPEQRAREVRQAITEDPLLGTQYEELARLDAELCAMAATAAFEPRPVRLAAPGWSLYTAGAVVALVTMRLLSKWLEPTGAVVLQLVVLACILFWSLRLLAPESGEPDRHAPLGEV